MWNTRIKVFHYKYKWRLENKLNIMLKNCKNDLNLFPFSGEKQSELFSLSEYSTVIFKFQACN